MEIGAGSAFSSGVQGLQRASGQITEETININRQATEQRQVAEQRRTLAEEAQPTAEQQAAATQEQARSLESSVVQLVSETNNAQANVRSIETADQVLGSIIDLRV